VIGTRPEAIKLFSPIMALRDSDAWFETIVCSSGQHLELLSDAIDTFGLVVDHELSVMSEDQDPADVAWKVGQRVSDLCDRIRPDWVMVQGDTTTAMAAGLASFYRSTPVAHVEAGLRTHDNSAPWPEEVHRRIIGTIADLHFAPTELAASNLRHEGVEEAQIFVTGNTGIDALHWALSQPRLETRSSNGQRRVVVTAHRRESTPDGIESILLAVRQLAGCFPDVGFQVISHPSPTVQRCIHGSLEGHGMRNIEVLTPRSYVDFVHMLADSFLILTDSGGVQEEAPALGKPVLVVNRRTARQEPVEAGTARVVGTQQGDIIDAVACLLEDPAQYERMATRHYPYGDGHAGQRIVEILRSKANISFRGTRRP
jgi:UDP-N-acetylglucosamine 2-epimerase (non-hydrolysing)